MKLAPARRASSLLVAAALIVVLWRPARADDERTDLVLHPDAPIVDGRNVLWCATGQLAWDALADAVSKDGKLRLGPPAPPERVARMNQRWFPHADIDPKAVVAIGGLSRDGVVERVRAAWLTTFGASVPAPSLTLRPADAVGIAGFRKSLAFAQPFMVFDDAMQFGGGDVSVRAWGLEAFATGPGAVAAAAQVMTFLPPGSTPFEPRPATIVELQTTDPTERIVLAKLKPRATLLATWNAVDEMLRTWTRDSVDAGSLLQVPTLRVSVDAHFRSLEGAPIDGIPDSSLTSFEERVEFALSERGATLGAEAIVLMSVGLHPHLEFDGPFLVALRRAEARAPYLLLWLGNDALMERLVPPKAESIDSATLQALVGRWASDAPASRDASILRHYTLGIEAIEDLGFGPDAKPAPDEILRRHYEKHPPNPERLKWQVLLDVLPDGHVTLQKGSRGIDPSVKPSAGVVERLQGALTLSVREPSFGDPSRLLEVRRPMRVRDGQLEVIAGTDVWILKRR